MDDSSMLTITTGATGRRLPRTSKKRASDQCSSGSSTPRNTKSDHDDGRNEATERTA